MDFKYLVPIGLAGALLGHYVVINFLSRAGGKPKRSVKEDDGCCLSDRDYASNLGRNEALTAVEKKIEETSSSLHQAFLAAADRVSRNNCLSSNQQLQIYGLYKQATIGPCTTARPSAVNAIAQAKWDAWAVLHDKTSEIAKQEYIDCVKTFMSNDTYQDRQMIEGSLTNYSGGLGVSVSTLSMEGSDSQDWEVVESAFHYASTGAFGKIARLLEAGEDLNGQDVEGRSMLHWAVDRNRVDTVKELVKLGINLELKDADGLTALAYAVSCGYKETSQVLLNAGADPYARDNAGETLIQCADNELKETLAQYMC